MGRTSTNLFLLTLLAGVFLFALSGAALAAGLVNVTDPPADVLAEANAVAKQVGEIDYNFFAPVNETGQTLRYGQLLVPDEGKVNYLVWGPWHSDPGWDGEGTTAPDRNGIQRARYIGYGAKGERVSNVFYPPDRSGGWRKLSDADFIKEPWKNAAVRLTFPQFFSTEFSFDGKTDPDLIAAMRGGLRYCAVCNDFEPPDENSDLYQNPQEYIHVFLPMSSKTWGMGVMFSRDPDGSLMYKSVPLAENIPVPSSSITLTPAERVDDPGRKVTFNLNTGWNQLAGQKKVYGRVGVDLGFIVRVSHRVNGKDYAAPFTLDGRTGKEVTPGWSEVEFPDPGNSAALNGTVEVTVQNTPSEVVAQLVPYIRHRNTGEVVLLTGSSLFKEARAKVRPNTVNLKVTAITLTPNPGQEGDLTSGTVTVVNESPQAFAGVATRWVVRRPDGSALAEGSIPADYAPNEKKQLTFSFMPDCGGQHSAAAMVNPDGSNPPNEVNFLNGDWPGDNRKEVPYWVDYLTPPEPTPGDKRLTLQAYSMEGYNINGEWEPSVPRDPFEAKWTDDVHAVLRVDPPVLPWIPNAVRGPWLDWYCIDWAELTYPKVSPDFSFGNPVPPSGTVTVSMSTDGSRAECWFEEDWALDGFGIYNMMTGEDMATEPKEYPIKARFKVSYQYSYEIEVWVSTEDGGYYKTEQKTEFGSYTDTATAYLLVTGAGMVPY